MNTRSNLLQHLNRRCLVTGLLLLAFVSPLLAAEPHYLKKNRPDPIALLAPPPLPGSPEQAADFATVVNAQKNCSAADESLANSEKKYYVFNFAPAIGAFFQSNSLPKTALFFQRLQDDISHAADMGKNHWKRPRPYIVDTNLAPGEMEASFSYPSGHSTKAIVFATLLSEIFPDKRAEIFAIGRDIGWHRVQLARHYPTDVQAGRVLGQAIAREMKKSAAFKKDFAEVKAELLAAKNGATPSRRSAAPSPPSVPSAGDGARQSGNLKNF